MSLILHKESSNEQTQDLIPLVDSSIDPKLKGYSKSPSNFELGGNIDTRTNKKSEEGRSRSENRNLMEEIESSGDSEDEKDPLFFSSIPLHFQETPQTTFSNEREQVECVCALNETRSMIKDLPLPYFLEEGKVHVQEGSFGRVFRIRKEHESIPLIIKVSKIHDLLEYGNCFPTTSTMIREAGFLQTFMSRTRNQSSIVPVHEVMFRGHCATDGKQYEYGRLWITESRALGDLHQFSNNTFVGVWNQLFQMVHGLGTCHMHSFLHRDLKLENFLVSENGSIWLCDMGLGMYYEPKLSRTLQVQTCFWRAPEIFYQDVHYTEAADVFALGVCLLEYLLGCHPFEWLSALHAQNERLFPFNPKDLMKRAYEEGEELSTHNIQWKELYLSLWEACDQWFPWVYNHPSSTLLEIMQSGRDEYHVTSKDFLYFLQHIVRPCLSIHPHERPTTTHLLEQFAHWMKQLHIPISPLGEDSHQVQKPPSKWEQMECELCHETFWKEWVEYLSQSRDSYGYFLIDCVYHLSLIFMYGYLKRCPSSTSRTSLQCFQQTLTDLHYCVVDSVIRLTDGFMEQHRFSLHYAQPGFLSARIKRFLTTVLTFPFSKLITQTFDSSNLSLIYDTVHIHFYLMLILLGLMDQEKPELLHGVHFGMDTPEELYTRPDALMYVLHMIVLQTNPAMEKANDLTYYNMVYPSSRAMEQVLHALEFQVYPYGVSFLHNVRHSPMYLSVLSSKVVGFIS